MTPPEYIFLISELAGEQRFASVVARRLESMGALTHGDRHSTEKQQDLSKFNFDTSLGKKALDTCLRSIRKSLFSKYPPIRWTFSWWTRKRCRSAFILRRKFQTWYDKGASRSRNIHVQGRREKTNQDRWRYSNFKIFKSTFGIGDGCSTGSLSIFQVYYPNPKHRQNLPVFSVIHSMI